jgi:transposase
MDKSKKSNEDKITALRNSGTLNPSPEKVQEAIFQNEKFFDPRDLVQIKYELLRQVQIEGVSIVEATKRFGLSRLSYYRILAIFEKFGFSGLIPRKRGPKQGHKLTDEILEFINKQIQKFPSINNLELKTTIKKKFGLSVHVRTIERALVKKKRSL